MKVEILFCNSNNKLMNFLSGIIRWGQDTKYSHMAIYFPDMPIKTKDVFSHVVLDATLPDGVALHTITKFKEKYKIINKKEFFIKENPAEVKGFLMKHIGKQYSWLGIIGFGMMKLKLVKNNPFGANQKMIVCSELVMMFLEYCNLCKRDSDIDNYDLKTVEEILNKI